MYTPDLASILQALNISQEKLNDPDDNRVEISMATLRLLLKYVSILYDFDSAVYLRENPDVAAAVESGQIEGC